MMVLVDKPLGEEDIMFYFEEHPIKKVIFGPNLHGYIGMRFICDDDTDLGFDFHNFDLHFNFLFWEFSLVRLYFTRINGNFPSNEIRIKNKEFIKFLREGILEEEKNKIIREENEFKNILFPERETINAVTEINGTIFEKRSLGKLFIDYEKEEEED
jgi:hypothetical protein